jgi:hypothetical protein
MRGFLACSLWKLYILAVVGLDGSIVHMLRNRKCSICWAETFVGQVFNSANRWHASNLARGIGLRILGSFSFAAVFALAGCQTTGTTPDPLASAGGGQGLPPNYRQIITDEIHDSVDYRSGIRNAQISQPVTRWAGPFSGGTVPTVCVRYQTQNPAGIFIGSQLNGDTELVYPFNGGKIGLAYGRVAGPANPCGPDRVYAPFPEVNSKS